MNKGMFTSKTSEWETPDPLFKLLDEYFHFDLDVCATVENAKTHPWFSPKDDGLSKSWKGHTCWMNPPYGNEIGKWMKKAYDETREIGTKVVCLVPARTETKWWHQYAMEGRIWFIKGRLKFSGSKTNAPFPNAIVCFDAILNPSRHLSFEEFFVR